MALLHSPKTARVPPGAVDTLASRIRPTSAGRDRLLPLAQALAPLFPDGGLRRGTVVGVDTGDGGWGLGKWGKGAGGATTLGFALLASATAAGAWCAALGTTNPGVLSMVELGLDLRRLALVALSGGGSSCPGFPAWPEVAATLLDGMDALLLRPPWPVRSNVARRLGARARERQAVLIVLGPPAWWPEGPDVRLSVTGGEWQGVGNGHGHLLGRRAEVTASGRRVAARPVRMPIWLPAASGALAPVPEESERART
ncbi:MAG: hypothetical protein ACRD6W_07200 [Nitrososphaerales archaeon]